jgi:hypothetical protein
MDDSKVPSIPGWRQACGFLEIAKAMPAGHQGRCISPARHLFLAGSMIAPGAKAKGAHAMETTAKVPAL